MFEVSGRWWLTIGGEVIWNLGVFQGPKTGATKRSKSGAVFGSPAVRALFFFYDILSSCCLLLPSFMMFPFSLALLLLANAESSHNFSQHG